MSPQLQDFLSDIAQMQPDGSLGELRMQLAVKDRFYRYLHERGVEHCNFGGFQLTEDRKGEVSEFAGSLLPETFQEEFTAEMAADDYVLLKASELSPDRPINRFGIGVPYFDQIAEYNPSSLKVQAECARHGIVDGFAIVGNTMAGQNCSGRFYGFAFAGDLRSGDHIRAQAAELEIAAQLLLDRIHPLVAAKADGFAYDITPRERDVLSWLAEGLQRQQIAYRLSISTPTVDLHLSNLRQKLGAATLAEVAAKGLRYGLV